VNTSIRDAVEAGDLDELLRIIDALCDRHDWDGLVEVRTRSRAALERGRQLWPAASHAEYRLALDAPAAYAAAVLVDGTGRFAIGPLPEVAASTHTWAELAPHVTPGPVAALAAHERVVRGEAIDPATVAHHEVFGVPMHLAPFEPDYEVATYRDDTAEFPAPELPRGRPLALPAAARTVDAGEVELMLREVVRAWTAGSEGIARVVAVEGETAHAIAALGVHDVHAACLDPAEALGLLAWAGASGGRHGRRRGAAAGRDVAWAAAAAIAGFDVGEPIDEDALGAAIAQLQWQVWNAPDISSGWVLRLAIADEAEGLAWAIDAYDPA
jgi:hypothetical protein